MAVMTIGTLSRRSGVPVKTLRAYEDMGLIYTIGRRAGNYRLFGEQAPTPAKPVCQHMLTSRALSA